jgi:alkanesulfonate monooxygenase SsuD/methylene tetrahydromethanopterin reductase-like flavin-dependent oxidoreductase (luciferase family)
MRFGLQLHADRGADAFLGEAQLADAQGFDSVWTGDHLFATRGEPFADRPLETWTLMAAFAEQVSPHLGGVREAITAG